MRPLLIAVPAIAAIAAFAFSSSDAKADDSGAGPAPGPKPDPTGSPKPLGSTPPEEVLELIQKAVESGNTSFMLTTADVLDKMGWKEQAASLRAAAKDIAKATGTPVPDQATTAKSAGLPPVPVNDKNVTPIIDTSKTTTSDMERTRAQHEQEVRDARQAMGLPDVVIPAPAPSPPKPAPAFAPTVVIRRGEGPYQVTIRLLGKADKWREIRDLNKAQYPIDPKSGSNKWNPGDVAKIPPSWGFTSSVSGDAGEEFTSESFFGRDGQDMAVRVAGNVISRKRGEEDRDLVETFQQQQRELGHYDGEICGLYNALTALCIARYGIAPPKPMYWPTNQKPMKNFYRSALLQKAGPDRVRSEEWQQAANVEHA